MKNEEYFFMAMRRSGHHAVMEWFFSLIPSENHHLINNITDDTRQYYKDLKKRHKKGHRRSKLNSDYIVFNSEDLKISSAQKRINQNIRKEVYGYRGDNITNIVVVRNHFNLFASRLKSVETKPSITKSVGAMSEEAKNMYCEHCSYLEDPNVIFIVYDKWFTSHEYRKTIAEKLGLAEYMDKECIGKVPMYGNGSSFDGFQYQGKPSEMQVLNRYENYLDNKKFVGFVTQDDLMQCHRAIFGKSSALAKLRG